MSAVFQGTGFVLCCSGTDERVYRQALNVLLRKELVDVTGLDIAGEPTEWGIKALE